MDCSSRAAARQASLTITNSQSSPKLMSIESVMLSSHLILCRPLLLPPVPPTSTGLPSKRGPGLGSFSRADRGIGGVRHVAPQLYNKKEKERQKGEEGGKQGTKIMVFLACMTCVWTCAFHPPLLFPSCSLRSHYAGLPATTWGISLPSDRGLLAGGFRSLHTPVP